ncbi:hypothetical protein WS70_17400 [Burkholderia mayonis]|uniref:Uncharacterized protein n=1 Tax=Burkholderia mayonis TaxID=1385591 RepID=A0A1B4FJ72_9BURK|nr:hypothetical protein WS70_17400 [Burkholderia mayonis]KVE41556.1 hypothetical protein WS69_05275 [Burkholderia sp. BDU5]KVE46885.1 hypothetical protein WS70_01305 [Burkholderia mayonis]
MSESNAAHAFDVRRFRGAHARVMPLPSARRGYEVRHCRHTLVALESSVDRVGGARAHRCAGTPVSKDARARHRPSHCVFVRTKSHPRRHRASAYLEIIVLGGARHARIAARNPRTH